MLLDKKDGAIRKKSGKLVVGYDLNDKWAQISYADMEEGEPETLAIVTGTEQFNIPLILGKRRGTNQWVIGKEAEKLLEDGLGEVVENLLTLAKNKETVVLEEAEYEAAALLTLFVKRSLSLLSFAVSEQRIAGLMFTVEELDQHMVAAFTDMAVNLSLKTERIYFQSHVESFYFYVLNQPRELWSSRVLLFDYDGSRMKRFTFDCNKKTSPTVVIIETEKFEEMTHNPQNSRQMDETFLELARASCGTEAVSCVYLTGEGYQDGWAKESLQFLCRNRRAFQGNNLFGKGACFGIREKLLFGPVKGEYVFLGKDKLKANVGMKGVRRGQESYFAILDAGVNWFEAKAGFDIILESGNSFSILITPLNGKEAKEINMIMEGLPERPPKTTRLHVEAEMMSETKLHITAADKGFGEMEPSSGGEWRKLFEV